MAAYRSSLLLDDRQDDRQHAEQGDKHELRDERSGALHLRTKQRNCFLSETYPCSSLHPVWRFAQPRYLSVAVAAAMPLPEQPKGEHRSPGDERLPVSASECLP